MSNTSPASAEPGTGPHHDLPGPSLDVGYNPGDAVSSASVTSVPCPIKAYFNSCHMHGHKKSMAPALSSNVATSPAVAGTTTVESTGKPSYFIFAEGAVTVRIVGAGAATNVAIVRSPTKDKEKDSNAKGVHSYTVVDMPALAGAATLGTTTTHIGRITADLTTGSATVATTATLIRGAPYDSSWSLPDGAFAGTDMEKTE